MRAPAAARVAQRLDRIALSLSGDGDHALEDRHEVPAQNRLYLAFVITSTKKLDR
jgi:hypothetical protein